MGSRLRFCDSQTLLHCIPFTFTKSLMARKPPVRKAARNSGISFGGSKYKGLSDPDAADRGREAARHGGPPTAILGAALHFFIAFSVVAAYYLASRRLALLRDRPVLCGLLYGVLVYVVMTFVVVPLSAAFNPPLTAPSFVNGLLGPALLLGLPSALFARRA